MAKIQITPDEAREIVRFIKQVRYESGITPTEELNSQMLKDVDQIEKALFKANIQPENQDVWGSEDTSALERAYTFQKSQGERGPSYLTSEEVISKEQSGNVMSWGDGRSIFKRAIKFNGQYVKVESVWKKQHHTPSANPQALERKINEWYENPHNPVLQFFKKLAEDTIDEAKRYAYGLGSQYADSYQELKLRTGTLANSLSLQESPSADSGYHFVISAAPYYRWIAEGRSWNNAGVIMIPLDNVYNKSKRDLVIATKTGGFTFRNITPEVKNSGTAPNPFIATILSNLWAERQTELKQALAEAGNMLAMDIAQELKRG